MQLPVIEFFPGPSGRSGGNWGRSMDCTVSAEGEVAASRFGAQPADDLARQPGPRSQPREVVSADGAAPQAAALLQQNRFVIAARPFRRAISAYTPDQAHRGRPSAPPFITTASILA